MESLTNELTALKDANYDVIIKPANASDGVLDQDEMARVAAGVLTMIAGSAMIWLALFNNIGDNAQMVLGAGIPMIPGGAAIVAGGKAKP